jgi:phosphoglycerate dehydrogenase-like enzyme
MSSTILVHPKFDGIWPLAADHAHRLWSAQGEVEFVRVTNEDTRAAHEIVADPRRISRLLLFGVPLDEHALDAFPVLCEVGGGGQYAESWHNKTLFDALNARGIRVIQQKSEGFWGQSVAEFGLALTLCGLRRIPQMHHNILTSHYNWQFRPDDFGLPGARGQQFGDDPDFTSGTLEGKRVRVVGAGNIASRYASFCHFLGADVAAWDPFAPEPCFHRAGSRREHFLDHLMQDAEIFAPMVPLTEETRGLVTASHIESLPKGTLVVMVTRADIVDVPVLLRRVLNDELALAADVFNIEPLPLKDPLLGRHNVVHTPHIAGRTRQANERYAEALIEQFAPR